jgi:hypothetical protein
VYRLVNHFVTLADYRTMNIMLNFVKVIVQWLTNCVTSYASIKLSEPDRLLYTLHKKVGYHKNTWARASVKVLNPSPYSRRSYSPLRKLDAKTLVRNCCLKFSRLPSEKGKSLLSP